MLKRNELSSHEQTWRNFKCILLSERSPHEKAPMKTVKRSVVAKGLGGGGMHTQGTEDF